MSQINQPGAASRSPFAPSFFSLTRQIRYGLLLFVTLNLLLSAGLLVWLSSRAQVRQLQAMQQERSRVAASEINAYLTDLQHKLNYLGGVRGLAQQPTDIQQRLLEALRLHDSAYDAVAIADQSGAVVAAVSSYGSVPWRSLADSPEFSRVLLNREDVVGPIELDPATRHPAVILAVPTHDKAGQVAGALLARVNLSFLWQVVSDTEVGETGYSYVLDEQNVLIAEKGSTPENFQLQKLSNQDLTKRIIPGRASPLATYQGLRGVEVLGAVAPIESVGWSVVVELPTEEAYAPVAQLIGVMSVVLAVSTLLAAALGVLVARRIAAPLKQLTTAAERISTGDLDTQVELESNNELGVLAFAFNDMTSQLRGLFGALRESERRFHAIFNQSFQFIGLLSPDDGVLLEVNQTALDFIGRRRHEVIGQPCWLTGWWSSSLQLQDQLQAAMAEAATGRFVRYEAELLDLDGRVATIDFSLKPIANESGAIVLLILEGRDITDRKQIEETTRRLVSEQAARAAAEVSQRRFAFLSDASALLASSLNYELTLQRVARLSTPHLADWCVVDLVKEDGATRRLAVAHIDPDYDALTRELQRRYPPNPEHSEGVSYVLRTGKSLLVPDVPESLIRAVAHDAPHLQILQQLGVRSLVCVPLQLRDRVVGAISFVISDGRRRYGDEDLQLAEELARRAVLAIDNAQLYEEAQAAIRVRDVFLSVASHELKTPLTSLLGNAQLFQRRALREGVLSERNQRSAAVIVEQAIRLDKMITALLDISRIEMGQLLIEREQFDLCVLARRVVEEIQLSLEGHTLSLAICHEPLVIEGDALRLEQVLQNLIGNAVKYSPNGGSIHVQLERRDTLAALAISDQGIGIPSKALPQLFQRFYRANNVDEGRISGLGIGLFVVKEIVSLHNGTVDVASQEGVGSTFTVYLPLAAADANA